MGCRSRCCSFVLLSASASALALLALWSQLPRRELAKDACKNAVPDGIRTLPGFPFSCGWQQLRPRGFNGSEYVPYAFIQPIGSWCWSNAGFVGRAGMAPRDGLLVDTLTDPVLTAGMLSELDGVAGPGDGSGRVGALVFTHPDIDHVLGNQAVARDTPRLGTRETQDEIAAQRAGTPMWALVLLCSAGQLVWDSAELVGVRRLLAALPPAARGPALKVLGWARSQTFMAHFSFHAVSMDRLPEIQAFPPNDTDLAVGGRPFPARFQHLGPIHSKSDSIILLRESRVAYAGDLLFIGIAPVMWGGPAKTWIQALDRLLEVTGEGWLFVPGHGPVTDAQGVLSVRRYFEHVDQSVTRDCADLPLASPGHDETCAERTLASMPPEVRLDFQEPQRVMISAAIERMARRAGGPAKVGVALKMKYIIKMGEYEVRSRFAEPGEAVGGHAEL